MPLPHPSWHDSIGSSAIRGSRPSSSPCRAPRCGSCRMG